ncbi:MAG TPA: helix-turn-helix domain-containing protein [Acidimicrobiia bacterium]|jgi:DNA-binding response OmpR family regulator
MTDVVLVRWPEEREHVERLRASGTPRLLLVGAEVAAPKPFDELEDWIRLPAVDSDVHARATTLAARAQEGVAPDPPRMDEAGILKYRGRWITLSRVERALARALVDRFTAVVRRDTLIETAWPSGESSRNALDVHMVRLRRRLLTVGLEVRTVRARGYLLQPQTDRGLG